MKSLAILLVIFGTVGSFAQTGTDHHRELMNAPAPQPYHPMTFRERLDWTVRSTVGGESLTAGLFTSGFGTAIDHPKEYGPHWDGFAERYGMRLTGVATSNVMEAGLGILWGEDPHYFPMGTRAPFKARIENVLKQTVYARERDGGYELAYARMVAIPASNFLSNTWRADSESNVHDALIRTVLGFTGRMTRNAWEEFRPLHETRFPGQ